MSSFVALIIIVSVSMIVTMSLVVSELVVTLTPDPSLLSCIAVKLSRRLHDIIRFLGLQLCGGHLASLSPHISLLSVACMVVRRTDCGLVVR